MKYKPYYQTKELIKAVKSGELTLEEHKCTNWNGTGKYTDPKDGSKYQCFDCKGTGSVNCPPHTVGTSGPYSMRLDL